jgi:hypothetical protein
MRVGGVFLLLALVVASSLAQQRTCVVPCVHRYHPYDVVPCVHVCYGPYGPQPCHPNGDAVPCVHVVHPYGDVVPCASMLLSIGLFGLSW